MDQVAGGITAPAGLRRRRATHQVRRLLEVAESNYFSLLRSQRYVAHSMARNREQWLSNLHEMEIAWWSAMAILRWVLMEELSPEQLKWVPKELEDEIAEHRPGD
jgi:hypothetical protein